MACPSATSTTLLPSRLRAAFTCLIAGLCVPLVSTAQVPKVTDIVIEGNRTTRPEVILREMALAIGDPAAPTALDNSRQAIQDLGLFRSVTVDAEPGADGATVRVRVHEKRYLLPIPRIDGNSEGDYSYGAQLRWSNLGGRNHRLVAYVEEEKIESERDRDRTRSARISYSAPYLRDDRHSLALLLDHTEQYSLDREENRFIETFNRAQVLVTRDLRDTRPRRGWVLGTGLLFSDQDTRGEFAPPPDGRATAGVATAEFSNLRFNLYSQTGRDFFARAELAHDGVLGDYGYERLDLNFRDYRRVGRREHQTLHLIAAGGVMTGGPRSRNAYSLGGSSRMRGYDSDAIEGDTFWYGSVEYLRPLRWDWLRLLANVEVGGARRNVFGERNRDAYASIGLGLRARITWFVDIEIEAGIALPLVDGDGARFFASTL